MRFELFKDRNFAAACLFMVMIGVSLFGTMALITPFTQNLLGYPILTAGFVLGSRGVGTLVAMMAVGRLLKFVEARTLVFCGLTLTAATLYQMVGFTTDTSTQTIVVTGIIQGAGLGLVFVPLSTVAFATLPGESAQQRHRDADAGSQHRQLDRHLDGDRQPHQHDDADARAAGRAHHAVQQRACSRPARC